MRFAKWHGLGNDYLIVDREAWPLALTAARARRICDPHFGVGGDGILEVSFEEGVPRMTVWNADGSQAENCGNGIRMVARHLEAEGRLPADGRILTGGGPVTVRMLDGGRVEVQMGRARFPAGERRHDLRVNGEVVELAEVSMGNPHAVIEHASPADVVERLGPVIEVADRFPQRTNVEFVRSEGPSELTMRVWERGVGETLACGTGACAAAVAAVRLGVLTSPVTVHLKGGDLVVAASRRPGGHYDRTGPGALRELSAAGLVRALEEFRPRPPRGGEHEGRQAVENLPPYLFAEMDRKSRGQARRGRGRHLAGHRRPRPAHAGPRWSRRMRERRPTRPPTSTRPTGGCPSSARRSPASTRAASVSTLDPATPRSSR